MFENEINASVQLGKNPDQAGTGNHRFGFSETSATTSGALFWDPTF